MKSKSSMARAFAGAAILMGSLVGGAGAQQQSARHDVTIVNDHMHVHRVLVFDAEGERHRLGFIGHDEMKDFDIPAEVEAKGPYTIALQQFLPLPGIGVSAAENPLKVTPVLNPAPGEIVSIIVGNSTHLSSVEVLR